MLFELYRMEMMDVKCMSVKLVPLKITDYDTKINKLFTANP